jgi:methylase of polypeptide subunit release factors
MHTDLVRAALDALSANEFKEFQIALTSQATPSLGLLLVAEVSEALEPNLSGSVVDWIMRESTWHTPSYRLHVTPVTGETFLQFLWQDLVRRLTLKLTEAFQRIALPARGAILCFFAGAELSVVVRYQRYPNRGIKFEPIAVEEHPDGLFELVRLFAAATPIQRNRLKAAALSPAKLVFQQGVLVHVDRLSEDVFGPTIDTVILAELLAQWVDARAPNLPVAVLEVGPGSGLLTSVLALAVGVERIYAIDINPAAVSCTLKNLEINGATLEAARPQICIRAERFKAGEFAEKVDLIVCNPPYIPDAPSLGVEGASGYLLAVGDDDFKLYRDLLGALEGLLLPGGRLLLMMSSVSAADVEKLIPDQFQVAPAYRGEGWRVPLDVDVVWERRDWQEQLLREVRIEEDREGILWHYLRPIWVRRKGDSGRE